MNEEDDDEDEETEETVLEGIDPIGMLIKFSLGNVLLQCAWLLTARVNLRSHMIT